MGNRHRPGGINDLDLHVGDALDGLQRLAGLAHKGRRILSREQEREGDMPVPGDGQVPDHPCGEQVVPQSRILDPAERGGDWSVE
jgi:hypothetical protein